MTAPSAQDMPDYATPRLAEAVERLPPDAVDALPFGAIRLDSAGTVTFYSKAERALSGYTAEVLGRPFFTDIAPCMNNPAFRGRIDRALAAGTLDIAFDHIGDFDDDAKELRVRIQSASGGGCWIFMKRIDDPAGELALHADTVSHGAAKGGAAGVAPPGGHV